MPGIWHSRFQFAEPPTDAGWMGSSRVTRNDLQYVHSRFEPIIRVVTPNLTKQDKEKKGVQPLESAGLRCPSLHLTYHSGPCNARDAEKTNRAPKQAGCNRVVFRERRKLHEWSLAGLSKEHTTTLCPTRPHRLLPGDTVNRFDHELVPLVFPYVQRTASHTVKQSACGNTTRAQSLRHLTLTLEISHPPKRLTLPIPAHPTAEGMKAPVLPSSRPVKTTVAREACKQ